MPHTTIGATPYLPVLAGIQAGNIALAVIISATFAIWIWFWIPNIMAYGTRSMIAWSFDRVAPDRLGYVSGRFHTPVVAIWTFTAAGVAGVWLIAYRHLALLTFFEVLVGVWLIAMLAAMIFPYRRTGIYRPFAAGPMIKKPLPVEFWITTGTAALGTLWYLGVKAYRRRQGIDIRLAFQQIPIE